MNILVTGGAGFIGSHLVEHHLAKGDQVYAIDDFSSGRQENITTFLTNPNFYFINEDILHWPTIDETIAKMDRIYHMAAVVGVYKVLEEPEKVLCINIIGYKKLLDAILKSPKKPRIIVASSSEVYGLTSEPLLEESANIVLETNAKNRWYYAISKLADESFSLAFQKRFDLSITSARLFNTIGPRQVGRYGMVVPRFISQAVKNEPITVFGSGNQTRSFCDVRDTVMLLDQLAENEKSTGEVVNIGNDREIAIMDLAILIKRLSHSDSEINHLTYSEAYGEDYVDIQRRKPDLKKMFSYVNYKHQWKLEDSILNLISICRVTLADTEIKYS